jgi:ketosteroid isomerase-like protein
MQEERRRKSPAEATLMVQGTLLLFEERAMRIVNWVLVSLLLGAPALRPQQAQPSNTTTELTAMLNQFMSDASNNNRAGFDRFFADDVIYTGSNGLVHTKADMMRSMSATKPAQASEEKRAYSAENILVHDFGDTAIVAFQLVAHTQDADGKTEISNYRDTGTFLRRNGRWQVIAWQATKMPEKAPAK